MRRTLLAIILLASGIFGGVSAEPIAPPAYGECRNHQGQPVTFLPLEHHKFRMMFPITRFGTAITMPWGPTVAYDYQDLGMFPDQTQELVLWHECAHHQLGHLGQRRAFHGGIEQARQNESEADCQAGRNVMTHRKFTEADLEIGLTGLEATGMRDVGTHDDIADRVKLTRSCALGQ